MYNIVLDALEKKEWLFFGILFIRRLKQNNNIPGPTCVIKDALEKRRQEENVWYKVNTNTWANVSELIVYIKISEIKLNIKEKITKNHRIHYLHVAQGNRNTIELPHTKFSRLLSERDMTLYNRLYMERYVWNTRKTQQIRSYANKRNHDQKNKSKKKVAGRVAERGW